jgi:hypothetical protein
VRTLLSSAAIVAFLALRLGGAESPVGATPFPDTDKAAAHDERDSSVQSRHSGSAVALPIEPADDTATTIKNTSVAKADSAMPGTSPGQSQTSLGPRQSPHSPRQRLTVSTVAFQYNFGAIDTRGVAFQVGLKTGNHYFGLTCSSAKGHVQYKPFPIPDATLSPAIPGDSVVERYSSGLGVVYYYEGLNLADILIVAPGAQLGYWLVSDSGLGEHVEVVGPRVKVQVGYRRAYMMVESAWLFNLSAVTPQVTVGLLLVL